MRDATADAQNPVYLKAKLEEGSWRVADEMAELLIGTVTETLYKQWDWLDSEQIWQILGNLSTCWFVPDNGPRFRGIG